MSLDRILELLAKQIGGVASDADLNDLEYFLKQHPDHHHLVSILKAIQSKKLKQPNQNEELVVRQGWEKLQKRLSEIKSESHSDDKKKQLPFVKRISWRVMARAAIFIGVAILGFFVYRNQQSPALNKTAKIQEAVPHGKPEVKTLPDGSIVWINAGSVVRYEEESDLRNVWLEGEAYFKVKHDSNHPFIVHAGTMEIQALGTEFNVQAYPGENHVETTLIEGKVQVTMDNKPDQKIILLPSEKLTVENKPTISIDTTAVRKELRYEVKAVEIVPALQQAGEVAWMQDRLAFQNESFFSLAKKMERRYNVHIVFHADSLKSESFTGVFVNESIEKALRVLQMITPFKYRINGDSVLIQGR